MNGSDAGPSLHTCRFRDPYLFGQLTYSKSRTDVVSVDAGQDDSPQPLIPMSEGPAGTTLPGRTSDEQDSWDVSLTEWMEKTNKGSSNGSGCALDDATMQIVQKLTSANVR